MDKGKLTPDQQFFIDKTIEFAKDIYSKNENKINNILKAQKGNRDEILNEIAKTLLSYSISDNVLALTAVEKTKLYTKLSKLITERIQSELKNEINLTHDILISAASEKYDTSNYLYSLGVDYKLTQLSEKKLNKVINSKIKGELWSDRLYNDKNAIAKDLKTQIKSFLKGNINVNDIESVIKTKYNTNASNSNRLVNTEIARVQTEANDVWAEDHNIQYQLFMATLDSKTSFICREHDGQVWETDSAGKPIPPLHPNCRSALVNIPSKNWKPKMRLDNEAKENINWQSYQEWKEKKG